MVRKRWRRAAAAAVAIVCSLAVAACGGGGSAPPASAGGTSSPQASAGTGQAPGTSGQSSGAFVYDAYTQIMINWDPATAYEQEQIAMMNLYETLTRYNPSTGTIQPVLATKWVSSNDSKTWTFTLRRGVKFHTGRPFNAAAAKACILRTNKLDQGAGYEWGAIKSISTPTPYTLVLNLKYPQPMALIAASTYSAYMYDTKAAGSESLAKWFGAGHDAGTGPYMVEKASPGQDVELIAKAFPGYWGGWSGPHYKTIEYRVVREDSTAAQLARSGQVSFVQQLNPVLWSTFKNSSGFQTPSARSFQNVTMYLNTASGPLKSLAARRAVAMAINYSGIVAALKGAAVREHGLIPPGLFGQSNSIPEYQYDPAKAKQLLAQAGYGNGKTMNLKLTYTQGDSNEQEMATLVKSELAQVGVTVTTQALTTSAKYARARSSNPANRQDLTFIYWWPDYPDADTWFLNLVHTQNPPQFNFSYYSNKTLDRDADEVDRVAPVNPSEAKAMYRQMEMIVYNNVPVIPMYNVVSQEVLPDSVVGYHPNPSYPDTVFVYDVHPKT